MGLRATLLVTAATLWASSALAQPAVELTPTDESAWDIPGELLVDFADDTEASDIRDVLRRLAVSFAPTALEDETKVEIVRAAPSRMDELRARLAADPRVEIVEPNARVRASFVPDDPLYKEQWHLTRVGAERAWSFSTGRGVTVAVVDTGIACEDFPPFSKASDLNLTRCVPGYNFVAKNEHAADDQGHGTHVAGTIAQSTNNAIGAAGVAFEARLMPVKVLSSGGWGTLSDVADGIRWAADHGAQVINLSLGGPRDSKILERAVAHAREKGVVVVAAAGNSGGRVEFPGGTAGVIGVSATDSKDRLAWFSSRGPGVDIAAPGVGVIQQTICNGGRNGCETFPSLSGTSMASPHVAGVAALLVSLGVTEPDAVQRALESSAEPIDRSPGGKKKFGAGLLSAQGGVSRVALRQVLTRLLALAALIFVVFRWARRKGPVQSPWHPSFLVPALATGPGLLFFAPFLLPRTSDVVDAFARPIADLDLLLDASLHGFLPLANVALPLVLTLVFLGVPGSRRPLAGVALGTAAYLASVIVLGNVYSPVGSAVLTAWCAVNALACMLLARLVLARTVS
ncbi:MAG: peptidase S8 [Myxococcales bacterium]|nr:peptidase S8 [Myxococcales bacterium]MCB9580429.1 peptidase S8 [Polyangiaceae bacterium]